MIGLLVLAVTIGASAQTSQQYRAEIPFDFEARGQHFAAGQYSIGPLSEVSQGGVALRNLRKGGVRVLGLNALGGNGDWNKPGTITFLKINGRYRMSEISTATFSMKIKGPKSSRGLARDNTPSPEAVAVNLYK